MKRNFLSILKWDMLEEHISFLITQCEANKNDHRANVPLHKEASFLQNVLNLKNEIQQIIDESDDLAKELSTISDPELYILYQEEVNSLNNKLSEMQKNFEQIIYQNEANENKPVFIEIRAGTGGQEAALFVADLTRMYTLFAQKKNLTLTVTDAAFTEIGGYREIILHVDDPTAFFWLQFESGVHRVQRVPTTENAGRVHTSTATVAVLPEVDEISITIDAKDLRIDTYRASGAGGQHVNKTDSAVRITHIPSGIVVQCQDERSQHKNKALALKALQAKLFSQEQEKQNQNISQTRKNMVSNADRSEKIRTYNYPQNRITDHRFGITLNQLDFIMNGSLENLLEDIQIENQKNKHPHRFIAPFLFE